MSVRPSWNWPFPAFALLLTFPPFSGGSEKHLGNPEYLRKKAFFPQISSDLLKPPSLKPAFAAPQHESTQAFFIQSFSRTLRVMDVSVESRGRPHPKVHFSAVPVMKRNFLKQGHPGVRVRNICWKSRPKSLCLCCFFPDKSRSRPRNIGSIFLRYHCCRKGCLFFKAISGNNNGYFSKINSDKDFYRNSERIW